MHSVLCYQNTIQNDVSITNIDDIHSCETARKQKYSIPTTSTPNHHVQRIATITESILDLHTPTILPPVGKEYTFFQKDGKPSQTTRYIKSNIMTKLIKYVILIDKFRQQCVVLKGMLQ